jgi:drug/metabolite transporter (DMT)-like permease
MSQDRLVLSEVALLVAYAAGMAGGQMLFKAAALRDQTDGTAAERAFSLICNAYFLGAVALYVALTVLWVWLLTFIPLSRAYPFVALAFAITPLLGGMVFAEPITVKLLAGIALLLGGLLLIAS